MFRAIRRCKNPDGLPTIADKLDLQSIGTSLKLHGQLDLMYNEVKLFLRCVFWIQIYEVVTHEIIVGE